MLFIARYLILQNAHPSVGPIVYIVFNICHVSITMFDMLSSLSVSVCFSFFFYLCLGVPRRQPHRRSGLANLPSVGAVP